MARSRVRLLYSTLLLAVPLAGPMALAAQNTGNGADEVPAESPAGYNHADAPQVRALRTDETIHLDGWLNEGAWRAAIPATEFTQLDPNEGAPATQRTEVYFLYTDRALYVGARLYDSGAVASRLGRRDDQLGNSDWFTVILDSYHAHRTAFRFQVNPAGVRGDAVVTGERGFFGDGGDDSWDPVWRVKTTVRDSGWIAEMRIPFSQLRFSTAEEQVWGIQISREISRNQEEVFFAFTPSSERGGVPRYGHLVGLESISTGSPLELLPYVVSRAEYRPVRSAAQAEFPNPFRDGSEYSFGTGLTAKYRLTSNLTLNATMNPDFGQVEVDPAVVNLTAFETFFEEKRPFFVEGANIFEFGGGGGQGFGRPGTQLFYSRRIGGRPQSDAPADAVYSRVPDATTILGAAKLTGRTGTGWSVGILEAATGAEYTRYITGDRERDDALVEPVTNYLVGRVERQFRGGRSTVGAIGTAVNRRIGDTRLATDMRSAAYVGGVDFSHEWADRTWSVSGYLAGSRISGEPEVMSAVQRSSARYYQRPDADYLEPDPNASSLAGYAAKLELEKEAGRRWVGDIGLEAIHPGFEVNDLGFQSRADRIALDGTLRYRELQPGRIFREWSLSLQPELTWNYGGDPLDRSISFGGTFELSNYWSGDFDYAYAFSALDMRLTRGGPLTARPASNIYEFAIRSDPRQPWGLDVRANYDRNSVGGSELSLDLELELRAASNWNISLGPRYEREQSMAQYVTTIMDPTATRTFGHRFVFAPLDQSTLQLEMRLNVAFRPGLTLELYAQPFIASGDFGPLGQLHAPRSYTFDRYGVDTGTVTRTETGDYVVDPDGGGAAAPFQIQDDLDFNRRSLRGNAVLRWEWRPGSTLFLVWQQQRSDFLATGDFDPGRDVGALVRAEPDNIFLVKVNYWLNP